MIVRSGKESAGSDADTSPSCLRRRIWAKASWSSPFLFKDVFFGGGGDAQQGCPDSGGNVFCAATVIARGMKKARGQKAFAEENIAGGGGRE